jgi:hypothetical protein
MVKHKHEAAPAPETREVAKPQPGIRGVLKSEGATGPAQRVYVPVPNYTPTPTPHEINGFVSIIQTPAYHVPVSHKSDGSPVQPTGANPNPVAQSLPTSFYDAAENEVLPS